MLPIVLHIILCIAQLPSSPIVITELEGVPSEWSFAARQAVNSPSLPEDSTRAITIATDRLEEFLADKGYLAAQVSTVVLDEGHVSLQAKLGSRFQLRAIEITGNRIFPSSKLRGALRLPTGEWLLRYRLDWGIDNMLRLYSERGYLRASTEYQITVERIRGETAIAKLRLVIDEKEQYRINNVTIHGIPSGEEDLARRATDLRSGIPFRPSEVHRAMRSLRNYYANRGYANVKVHIRTTPDDEQATVAVDLDVNTGNAITVRRHRISGNRGLSDLAIIPMLKPKPGEPYAEREVQASIRRLARCKAIAKAELDEIENDGVLRWSIEEVPATRVSGAMGYDPSSEMMGGSASLSTVNLWGGGESGKLSWWRQSEQNSYAELEYRHPGVGGAMGFVESAGEYEQQEQYSKWQAELGIGTEMLEGLEGAVGVLGGRSWNIEGKAVKQGVYSRAQLTTTDNRDNPHEGWEGQLRAEWAAKDMKDRKMSSRLDIPKLSGEFWRHEPLDENMLVSLRLSGSSVLSKGAIPQDEWWHVGGLAGPRGYLERELMGTEVWLSSLELRYLMGELSRVFLLGDGAALQRNRSDYDWHYGYGFGLLGGQVGGVWTIVYALGRDDTIMSGKVHVGYSLQF